MTSEPRACSLGLVKVQFTHFTFGSRADGQGLIPTVFSPLQYEGGGVEKTQPDIERDLKVLTYKQCFLIVIDVALQLCPCSDFGLKNWRRNC